MSKYKKRHLKPQFKSKKILNFDIQFLILTFVFPLKVMIAGYS